MQHSVHLVMPNLVLYKETNGQCVTPAFELVISKGLYHTFQLAWSGLILFLSNINSVLISLMSDIQSRNIIK